MDYKDKEFVERVYKECKACAKGCSINCSRLEYDDDCMTKLVANAAEAIEILRNEKSEWVRITDALPPDGEEVLLRLSDCFMCVGTAENGEFHLWDNAGAVTHWMSLPTQPDFPENPRWIDLAESSKDVPKYKCSECGFVRIGLRSNYCENCGECMLDSNGEVNDEQAD